MSVDTKYLLEVFRLEYNSRLNEVIKETDVFDDDGNMILSPDLKVRHKKSGYEYTIAQVQGDKPGDVQIVLRDPEEPRFEPPADGEEVLGGPDDEAILKEQDPPAVAPDLIEPSDEVGEKIVVDEEPAEEVVFVIDQEEFEKEYEVD